MRWSALSLVLPAAMIVGGCAAVGDLSRPAAVPTQARTTAALPAAVEPGDAPPGPRQEQPIGVRTEELAYCRQVRAETEAQARILGSPHVASDSGRDSQGSHSFLGLGLEATDFVQAELLRRRADLECRRYALSQAIAFAERDLETRAAIAGLRAKAEILTAKSHELKAVRADIDRALDRGDITISDATTLRDLASALEASRFAAQANAGRLSALISVHVPEHASIASLAAVEGELADIEARLRHARGWRLSTEAGVEAFSRGADAGVSSQQSEGLVPALKIRASYKLGALAVAPDDARAKAARQEAVYEDLLRPHQRVTRAQNAARAYAASSWQQYETVARALVETSATLDTIRRAGGDRTTQAGLLARLSVIRFSAERAEANAASAQASRLAQTSLQ